MKIDRLDSTEVSFRKIVEMNEGYGHKETKEFREMVDDVFKNLDYSEKAYILEQRFLEIRNSVVDAKKRHLFPAEEKFVNAVIKSMEK